MITKEQFINLIELHTKYRNNVDSFNKILGVDCGDCDLIDIPYQFFDMVIHTNFSDEGSNWIFWYLYDRISFSGEIMKAYHADHTEIKLDTIEDLWNLVKTYGIQ